MKILFLSSKQCENQDANNGDCIIIDTGNELIIYDCGCEDYANYILRYMKNNEYEKIKIVLSHNDDDHFKGIPVLIEKEKVSEITTVLMLKYVDNLLKIIDDGRKNKNSIKRQICDIYDNIKKLSGNNLKDAFVYTKIADGVEISGPGKEYILNAAAKGLDTTEGDTIDKETITNATSIHLKVRIGDKYLLLTGDSSFKSMMQENLADYDFIQLAHHGKKEIAENVFEELEDKIDTTYIISDNTGTSKGGSDGINTKGYNVMNTKESGLLSLDENSTKAITVNKGTLNDIYSL